ncbi:MAG: 6-phosphogluconolactonase [Actinomycetota bacterium]
MNQNLLGSPVHIGRSRDETLGLAASFALTLLEASDSPCFVVSGGATTPFIVQKLATMWRRETLPIILLSDERHATVPAERNDETLRGLLHDTPFATVRIVSPPTAGTLETAAQLWSTDIAILPPPSLALVSMAADGHIAGLFATCRYEEIGGSVVFTRESPKPPAQRISLSASFFLTVPHRIAIVIGSEKASILAALPRDADVPISRLRPTEWLVDDRLAAAIR